MGPGFAVYHIIRLLNPGPIPKAFSKTSSPKGRRIRRPSYGQKPDRFTLTIVCTKKKKKIFFFFLKKKV